MTKFKRIGLDTSKAVFTLHGVLPRLPLAPLRF